jgi:hypothetical protein
LLRLLGHPITPSPHQGTGASEYKTCALRSGERILPKRGGAREAIALRRRYSTGNEFSRGVLAQAAAGAQSAIAEILAHDNPVLADV